MRFHLGHVLSIACAFLFPALAQSASWVQFTPKEKYAVYLGVYKPIVWAMRDSDKPDNAETPFNDEGIDRFDLKDAVETDRFPTGVFATADFFGIAETRASIEWVSFAFDPGGGFPNGRVDRKDYALDLLLGFDVNRIGSKHIGGLIYQLYPYFFLGMGITDYDEKIEVNGQTFRGNLVLDDVGHTNLGTGCRFGLVRLLNVGIELGMKSREFKTVKDPQPDGIAGEGYLRVYFAAGYGR